ncbi:MAG TPA: lytic transglycosylase F [Terriglobales bacterium]|jgi:membrane-bound lytic murein transglycosylase MltF
MLNDRLARCIRLSLLVCISSLLLLSGCKKQESPAPAKTEPAAAQHSAEPAQSAPASTAVSQDELPPPDNGMMLPLNFSKHTGDLDEMVKRRNIRALVILNPIGFFYDQGQPRGVMYETMEDFQRFVNQKLKLGNPGVKVSFLPVTPAQAEGSLLDGMGDIIANGIVTSPEREKIVAFSTPILTGVDQVVISGPGFGEVNSIADLSGKTIYVNPLTTYYQNLQKINAELKKAGKPPIDLKEADKNLNEDDLIQMVHGGLLPATVTTTARAQLWSKVFDNLKTYPSSPIATDISLAFPMRKNNPQLKQLVDEYVSSHAAGTAFGNTLIRRYLQNTKWVTDATSQKDLQKFLLTVGLFKKYAAEYNFDYLMLAAQGYQESKLNQSERSPVGAVGIMQVQPKYAAAAPIRIPNVSLADPNIHAGAKMLRNIADTYFNDPKIDPMNRTLMVFASYNAGPNRIARLRKEATQMGLNPNVWFGNVELVAAKDIGQETVTYVGNIYKYYVAYKLALEQQQVRQKAKAEVKG